MTTPQRAAASIAAPPGTLRLGSAHEAEPHRVDRSFSRRHVPSRLRIGVIAPPWFAVPPTGYGGIERVVDYLVEGLCRAGHDVTLFASGGSRTSAKLVSTYEEPPSALIGDAAVEMAHTVAAYRMARRFDLIHDHSFLGVASGVLSPTPVVYTIHGSVTPELARLYRAVSPPINLITISDHQKSTLPMGLSALTVHNGIDLSRVAMRAQPGDYLLFVGRVSPDKGILDAIEIARGAGERLVVVVKINEEPEARYFEEHVKPALAGIDAEVFQQPSDEVKFRLYREAKATLFPIRWPEPFGLVMIESMATGTPVIAFRNGSVPEVIRHGETGFICDSVEDAIQAVGRLGEISRERCREHVVTHFSAETAVARHEEVYRSILEHGTIAGERTTAADAPTAFAPAGGGVGTG